MSIRRRDVTDRHARALGCCGRTTAAARRPSRRTGDRDFGVVLLSSRPVSLPADGRMWPAGEGKSSGSRGLSLWNLSCGLTLMTLDSGIDERCTVQTWLGGEAWAKGG